MISCQLKFHQDCANWSTKSSKVLWLFSSNILCEQTASQRESKTTNIRSVNLTCWFLCALMPNLGFTKKTQTTQPSVFKKDAAIEWNFGLSSIWEDSISVVCGIIPLSWTVEFLKCKKSIQRIGFSEHLVLAFRLFFKTHLFRKCLLSMWKAVNYMILLSPSHTDRDIGVTPRFGSQQQVTFAAGLLWSSSENLKDRWE